MLVGHNGITCTDKSLALKFREREKKIGFPLISVTKSKFVAILAHQLQKDFYSGTIRIINTFFSAL